MEEGGGSVEGHSFSSAPRDQIRYAENSKESAARNIDAITGIGGGFVA